jgi:hypothetical protein
MNDELWKDGVKEGFKGTWVGKKIKCREKNKM